MAVKTRDKALADAVDKALRDAGIKKSKRAAKSKGLVDWLGKRYGKNSGSAWAARGVRGGYRWWRNEATGWAERKAARKENREPKLKTRRAKARERVKGKAQSLTHGTAKCTHCGVSMSGKDAAGHVCGTATKTGGKFSKAKAQLKAMDRKGAMRHDPDAKRAHRDHRKATMTRPARVADTVKRRAVLVAGFGGRCTECNTVLRNSEVAGHKCWSPERLAGTDGAPDNPNPGGARLGTSNATQRPATSPDPTAPNPDSGPTDTGVDPLISPTAGNAPDSTTTNREGPDMTAPTKTTNGSPGGGGGGTASAAQIVAAWSAWSQEHPAGHAEMTNKMNATRQAVGQTANHIGAFAQWMATPRANGGGGFHPTCVQPLCNAAARMAESAGAFTDVLQAIAQVYGPVLAHYQSGVADPGSKYFSDGRVQN